jgi:hypothetical protein
MCEKINVFILNGVTSPAAYTCHTSRGESTVDYILYNQTPLQIRHTPLQKCNITDHDLQSITVPMSRAANIAPPPGLHHSNATDSALADKRAGHPMEETPGKQNTKNVDTVSYRWIEGDCLKNYSSSAVIWKAHTSTPEFQEAFTAIAQQHQEENETRATKIEEFLMKEATLAGVLKAYTVRTSRNPNKWAKHMAPWFNDRCKAARARYRAAAHQNGKAHPHTQDALQNFV